MKLVSPEIGLIFWMSLCFILLILILKKYAWKPILKALDERDLVLKRVELPRQELKGEIDIYNPQHWQSIQLMFQRNKRKGEIEKNATTPTDAINKALMEFEYGSNGSTESQELLQLPSDGNKSSS